MREYKFRGKRVDNGEWVYGLIVYDSLKNPFIIGQIVESNEEYIHLEYWRPVVPESVGEFTGLKDKNGKEIYENDLLQNGEGHPPAQVTWDNKKSMYVVGKYGCELYKYSGINKLVIGNTTDNPELLK